MMPISLFLVTVVLPSLSFADTTSGVPAGSTSGGTTVAIQNPLNSNYSTIPLIIQGLLHAVEYVGGIACALWIVWAGFLFVSAQGNPEKLEEAKRTITHALIGTGIILGASVILTIVTNTINAIKS